MTNTAPTGYTDQSTGGAYAAQGASRSGSESPRKVWRWTETKAGPKTTEFLFMVLFVAGVLIASYIDDNDSLHAEDGWLYAAIAASAYFISRGLAKSGTREPYAEDA